MPNIRINSNPSRKQYVATGGQTIFPVTFPFLANTDIVVYQNSTKLVITTDYTLSGAGTASGGTMTLNSGATVNDIITIYGDTPVDRTSIYSATVSNLTGDDLNSDFNRDIIMIKQLQTIQDYLQLQYAPYAEVSQNVAVTTDRWLPILPASGVWRKNAGNTAIETAVLPAYPIGSVGGDFTDANRLVKTNIASGNNIEQTNFSLIGTTLQSVTGSWTVTSASDLNLTASQYLNLNNQRWPASIGSEGQVVGVSAGVLAYLNVPTAAVPTIVNQIPKFVDTFGGLDDSQFAESGTDLLLPADPTVALAAATKQYVDNSVPTGEALTKVDDTNVTLTLGGSPSTALLNAASLTLGWTGQLGLSRGGTNASLTADNGGMVYSTGSALAILAATATAGQIVRSGSNAAPSWSTATYPATTTINRLLYSSANNVIADLATANSASLVTTSAGVPVFTSSLTDGQIVIGSTGATPVAASLTAGSGVTITPGAGSITISATGSGGTVTSVSGTANQIDSTGGATPVLSLSSTVVFPGTVTLNADPVSALQAVTKQYADALIAGLDFKGTCVAATTAALTVTYANGASGVGATLTNAGAMAAFSVDGQSPSVGQRVLIKNQASTFQNGIYSVTTVGSGAVNWVLTRVTDYDAPAEITPGDLVPVSAGTVNADTLWLQTATVTTVGTDAVTFSQFSSAPLALPVSLANGGSGAALTASTGGIVYSGAGAMAILSGTATARQMLQSGASAAPAWSTTTWPATTTANRILYSSATSVVGEITSANSAIMRTDSSGVPGFSASLTNGQLLIGSTGATPVAASLTAGTGITITPGAGSITIASSATGGGGLTWLATATASNSATLEFNALFSATYDNYLFVLDRLIPATDAVFLYSQMGTGAGPTYATTGYYWNTVASVQGSQYPVYGSNDAQCVYGRNSGGAYYIKNAAPGYSGILKVSGTNASSNPAMGTGTSAYADSSPSVVNNVTGWWIAAATYTAIKFYMSSGNITSGTIRMYGMQNS
jgi:hypothetical protein